MQLTLSDEHFRAMVPLVQPAYSLLTARATHPTVRRVLADFFCKIADAYGFSTGGGPHRQGDAALSPD